MYSTPNLVSCPLESENFCTGSWTAFWVFLASLTPTTIGADALSLFLFTFPSFDTAPGSLNFFLKVLPAELAKKASACISFPLPSNEP